MPRKAASSLRGTGRAMDGGILHVGQEQEVTGDSRLGGFERQIDQAPPQLNNHLGQQAHPFGGEADITGHQVQKFLLFDEVEPAVGQGLGKAMIGAGKRTGQSKSAPLTGDLLGDLLSLGRHPVNPHGPFPDHIKPPGGVTGGEQLLAPVAVKPPPRCRSSFRRCSGESWVKISSNNPTVPKPCAPRRIFAVI